MRRDTAANWVAVNPVLADGEWGKETGSLKWKSGNGALHWNELPYVQTPGAGIVAAEEIPAFTPVTALGARANSADPSACFGRVIGLAAAAIIQGAIGYALATGELTNPAWNWTAGQALFLSGTGLAASPPDSGFVQQIGVALSPTTVVIELSVPILL